MNERRGRAKEPRTFLNVTEIFDSLEAAMLVDIRADAFLNTNDVVGAQKFAADQQGHCLKYAQTVRGLIEVAYGIEIEIWEPELDVEEAFISIMHQAVEKARPSDALACVAGNNWTVTITRGHRGVQIEKDLVDQIITALDGGYIMWQRLIPDVIEPEARYPDAVELLKTAAPRDQFAPTMGIAVSNTESPEEMAFNERNSFLIRHAQAGNFVIANAYLPWHMIDEEFQLDVLIISDFAETLVETLSRWAPVEDDHIFIADDGWVIRVTDVHEAHGPSTLERIAASIQGFTGGTIMDGIEPTYD
jgi:hypothetical protein